MANYPTSVSTNSNLYIAVNGIQTTLAASILATDTTIQLTSTSGFPATGFVTIDNSEVVSYTGISGPNLTGCTRGADGTTAAPHSLGVTVGATIVAAHHNLLKDEIIAIETALGANLSNVFPATPTTGSGNVVLATSPTITSATLVTPALGTPASGVLTNCTGLPLTTGTTGVLPDNKTTATPNATASTIVERDANANTKVNTLVENFSTTVTAAGTTVLTAATSPIQQFTGTTTQTVTLPDCTTLSVGYQITVLNRSTGIVSVNNNGGSLQQAVPATAQTTFTCTNTGSANGTWDVSTSSAASNTAYREDYVVGTALNNYTGSTTVFNLVTPYSVGAHSLVVTLDGDVQTIGATVDYQETNSTTVTFNNALVTGQKVSFIFQTATSSGGTVNSGTAGQLAYYPSTGPTVSGTNDPTGISSIDSSFINVDRNRLVNGEMLVDQANEGAILSINAAGNHYGADGWYGYGTTSAGVFRTTRVSAGTPPANFKSYTHVDVTTQDATPAAGALYFLEQAMEGYRSRDFFWGTGAAKTVTLSFWVRSNLTGTFSGSFRNASGSRSYVFTYIINSANTWEQKTITLVGEPSGSWATDNTQGIYISFDLGTGSTYQTGSTGSWQSANLLSATGANKIITSTSNTLDLTGVQLELGSIATSYAYMPFDMLLALCQRYYEKSNAQGTKPATNPSDTFYIGAGIATNSYNISISMKVRKRVSPTAHIWDDAGVANQAYYQTSTSSNGHVAASAVQITDTFLGFNAAAPTGAAVYLNFQWDADART